MNNTLYDHRVRKRLYSIAKETQTPQEEVTSRFNNTLNFMLNHTSYGDTPLKAIVVALSVVKKELTTGLY